MLGTATDIDDIQITIMRALANRHRLRIVHLLGEGPHEVRELCRDLSISQAAVSQHLAAMRAVGLVDATRDGRCVSYALSDPAISAVCDLMRDVLVRRLCQLGSLAAAAMEPVDSATTPPEVRQVHS